MNAIKPAGYPIVESHIHYPDLTYLQSVVEILDAFHINRFNAVCVPYKNRLSVVPDCLHLKAHHPTRVFVSASLDFSTYLLDPDHIGTVFSDYIDRLLEMGCDGIKMWEGKPDIRRKYPIPPFDSEVYAPYWAKLEERGMPLVFHLNDPAEFWDLEKIPPWALQAGWFYGDGVYVNNEAQYEEVVHVLERHPNLKVVFAHFLFLSGDFPRLGSYLDRFPNMCVDVVPGSEMYPNFSRDPKATREFFIRYQDHIVYGTDFGAGPMLAIIENDFRPGIKPSVDPEKLTLTYQDTRRLFSFVQSFLETDSELTAGNGERSFFPEGTYLHGIGLPQPVLDKIYYKNFERLFGPIPRPLNPGAIIRECDRLIERIHTPGALLPGAIPDSSMVERAKSFFVDQLKSS